MTSPQRSQSERCLERDRAEFEAGQIDVETFERRAEAWAAVEAGLLTYEEGFSKAYVVRSYDLP